MVDLTMAGRTADALGNVNAVIEICKFWQVVNSLPLDRLIVSEARSYGFEIRAVDQSWLWQFIQVCVGGIPAEAVVSTVAWQ